MHRLAQFHVGLNDSDLRASLEISGMNLENMDSDLANTCLELGTSEPDLGSREFWEKILDLLEEGVSIHSADGRVVLANRKALEVAESSDPRLAGRPDIAKIKRRTVIYSLITRERETAGSVRIIPTLKADADGWKADLSTEQLATIGHMIAGLAHDLGTPLNIISGYAEYLLLKSQSGGGDKELKAIIDQARRIADYVKQIVELARPSPPRSEAIEPQAFFKNLSELLGSHLRKAGVEMAISYKGRFPLFYGDEARINQAFFSLILKGARAVGAGGSLELIIAGEPESSDEFSVILMGKRPTGEVADFSTLDREPVSVEAGEKTGGQGRSLARKILDELGARVLPLDLGGQGVALSIYLKR